MADPVSRVRVWQSRVATQALLVPSISKKLEGRARQLEASDSTATASVKKNMKEAVNLLRRASVVA